MITAFTYVSVFLVVSVLISVVFVLAELRLAKRRLIVKLAKDDTEKKI